MKIKDRRGAIYPGKIRMDQIFLRFFLDNDSDEEDKSAKLMIYRTNSATAGSSVEQRSKGWRGDWGGNGGEMEGW